MTYWPERVERITGIDEAAIVEVAHALGRAPRAMILTARGPEQQAQGVNNALAYINVALAIGAVGKPQSGFGTLTGQGNGQGGREHGQKADQLPGYRLIENAADRRHMAGVWDVPESADSARGQIRVRAARCAGTDGPCPFVMGSNPVVSAPDALRVQQRLASLDTSIVADFFLSETAELADIVLPAAQWAEESGTMTNLEGRVILRRRAIAPPVGVRTDLEILSAIAAALGRGRWFQYADEAAVFEELKRATAGATADYSGITLRPHRSRKTACSGPARPPGARARRASSQTDSRRRRGRARFHATPHGEIADVRDGEFPLLLTTGRVLAQYQSGTQTRRTPELQAVSAEPVAEIHPVTAAHAGVAEGDALLLTTRRGTATFKARLTRAIREDTVFVPFHWNGEQSANRLTHAALDPISRMPEFKVCAVRVERAPLESAS